MNPLYALSPLDGRYSAQTQELAALFSMKGTTKSCDIFNALNSTLNRFDIKLNNLSGVITDGTPSIWKK